MGGSGNIELHRLMRNRDNGIKQAKCLLKNAFGDGSPKAFFNKHLTSMLLTTPDSIN